MNRNRPRRRLACAWAPTAPAVAAGALTLALGACTPGPEPAAAASPEPPVTAAVPAAPSTGEVPAELLNAIMDDLTAQENVRREDITVERSESVIWPDGSLGCPGPDEAYTHAQVPGYWVVLRVGDRHYDYRASDHGHFRRCSASFKIQLPVG